MVMVMRFIIAVLLTRASPADTGYWRYSGNSIGHSDKWDKEQGSHAGILIDYEEQTPEALSP